MSAWLYAVLCVVLPAAWGVGMFYAFDAWERRRRRTLLRARPPIDYSI